MQSEKYRNIHSGERVFILGTGPSLNETPLDDLTDEYTIGINQISKIYDDTSWRPSYFCVGEGYWAEEILTHECIEDFKETIELGIPSFLPTVARNDFKNRNNIIFTDRKRHSVTKVDKCENELETVWSTDISKEICNTGSTVYVAAQIAAYMGFDEIYFLGCDLFEPTDNRLCRLFKSGDEPRSMSFESNTMNGKVVEILLDNNTPIRTLLNGVYFEIFQTVYKNVGPMFISDKNHFTDDYRPGEVTNEEKNKKFNKRHKCIEIAADRYGFEVYNATPGGYLEAHDRRSLNSVLS